MLASHTTGHGDVLTALCPILLVLAWALLIIGVISLIPRLRLLDPLPTIVGGVVLLILLAVLC